MAVTNMLLTNKQPLLGGVKPPPNPSNMYTPSAGAFPMQTPSAASLTGSTSLASRPPTGGAATPFLASAAFSSPSVTGARPPTAPQMAGSQLAPPGNNMTNPGYSEQALNQTQNRLQEDPYSQTQQNLAKQAGQPSQGQSYMDQNLGTLDGPGQGSQYWNQVSGQFQDPFAGEQYARQATQNYSPQGPASAFFNDSMGQYDQFTGYQGPQAAQGQYQSNASSGPMAGQSFYDQVGGSYDSMGKYTDPNLAAGQYQQTQGAFGDMPIAQFDPFYDRARQLGVQAYNQGAAGRGVYGSSEALSGVGNVITDIEAQRANRSFDAEMQRAQEQRMRQQLLGEQARAGDLSSLSAFGANMAGLETYGNLAKTAGDQTLGQQTMLGNQARDVDTGAQAAQNSNIEGVRTYGQLANNADSAEARRYEGSTNAMNQADRTQNDRLRTGADVADMADDNERGDYEAANNAANAANDNRDQGLNTASNIAHTGSADDLARLQEYGDQAGTAEDDRQARAQSQINATFRESEDLADLVGKAQAGLFGASQADFENWAKTELAPKMNEAGLSQQEQDKKIAALKEILQIAED